MKLQISDKSVSRIAAAIAMLATLAVCLLVGYGALLYASTVSSAWDMVKDVVTVGLWGFAAYASFLILAFLCYCAALLYSILTFVSEDLLLTLRAKLAS